MIARRQRRRAALVGVVALAVVAALAVVLVALRPGTETGPGGGGPRPAWFAADSVWNAALAPDAPRDPRSDALVAELVRQADAEIAANSGPWINTTSYSTPVYTVGARQPTLHVTLDTSNPTLQHALDRVPIPADARPAGGTDAQMVVFQPATDTMWELWVARRATGGWHARWGGRMTHVSRNRGWFPAPFGATATGLPLVGGLMTVDELRSGHIDHALALALPETKAGAVTWPAQRTDGTSSRPEAIPEGTRFRLDPTLDLANLHLPPVTRAIAEAARRYGIVVRDKSGVVTFFAQDPRPSQPDPYAPLFSAGSPSQQLAAFPWSRLQAVAPSVGR